MRLSDSPVHMRVPYAVGDATTGEAWGTSRKIATVAVLAAASWAAFAGIAYAGLQIAQFAGQNETLRLILML